MTVFVVIPLNAETTRTMALTVPAAFPAGKHYVLAQGGYLVDAQATSKEVSTTLAIDGSSNGVALVTSASGYWGAAPNDVWEWLKAHWTAAI